MAIVNFVFVYVLAGFILSWGLLVLFKPDRQRTLLYLVGYGLAPLLISLILNYLYRFFPHQPWWFYSGIIWGLWLTGLLVLAYVRRTGDFQNIRLSLRPLWQAVRRSSATAKLLGMFVILTIGFVFIRGQLYPTLWADAIYYLQQGHVYSVDRSLDRLTTLIPFAEDGSDYLMNPSIRPALPVLYSFFYTTVDQANIFIFSGSFLYFYYFLLTLGIFACILKKFNFNDERIIIGLTLLVSSYYFINFLILGFKEIILIFLLLVGLLMSEIIANSTAKIAGLWSALLGMVIGLLIFINPSGVIIGGVIGLVYLLAVKKMLRHIVVLVFFMLVMTGGELQHDLAFFRLVKPTAIGHTEANEYSAYKITPTPTPTEVVTTPVTEPTPTPVPTEVVTTPTPTPTPTEVVVTPTPTEVVTTPTPTASTSEVTTPVGLDNHLKQQILIKGKFQGFTQPQFYGIIFLLFAVLGIVRSVQKRQLVYFEKIVLGFFWLFFFIVMDPFFLNPHPQAYVLSISPKYTILLIPLAALFITMNYTVILNWLAKIKVSYLLLSAVCIGLLVPFVRNVAVTKTFAVFENIIPVYNSPDYYLHKFDLLFLGVGLLVLVLNIIFVYLLVTQASQAKKVATLNILLIFSAFIFPFLFLLNNNYKIVPVFRNILAPQAEKLEMLETNEEALSFLKIINYLNSHTDPTSKIFLLSARPQLYYLEDYHRWLFDNAGNTFDATGRKYVDVREATYIVINDVEIQRHDFSLPVAIEQTFGPVVLLKVLR